MRSLIFVLFLVFSCCNAERITTTLDYLDKSFPPNEPVIPEINGAFTVKVVARFDDITSGTRYWQRIFDFGNGPNSENIYLAQHWNGPNIILKHYVGGIGTDHYLIAYNALTQGTTDTWEATIDVNGRMSIAKNGVELDFFDSGVVPLAGQTRSNKLLGRSNWASDDDLAGAILGLQVINHSEIQSFQSKMELWNLPGQMFGNDWVASVYARFDNLATTRAFQRIFDFGNGMSNAVLFLSQYSDTQRVALGMYQASGNYACVTPAATPAILQGEMALWRVQVNAGSVKIEKNGVLLQECNWAAIPSQDDVFRKNLYIGDSHWSGDTDFQGVILGLRVDLIRPNVYVNGV